MIREYQDPFIIGNDVYNASIGWQIAMGECVYDFGYISSFKNAADELVELKIPDLYVFPIMFCYRHYIELSLKNICYRKFTREQCISLINKTSHRLPELWRIVKGSMNFNNEAEMFIDELVDFFNKIDQNSFSFRYPYNKDLNKRNLGNLLAKDNAGLLYGININLMAVKYNVECYDYLIRNTYDY